MVRKKDRFWEFVEKVNDGFKCKFCERFFVGGATRIKYHLAGAKGHDINICIKVPKDVQEEASLTIGVSNKKLKGASTSNKDKERKISSTSISKDDRLSRVFEKGKAECKVDILLGVFVEGLLAKLRSIVIEKHISFELGFKEGLIDLLILLTQIRLVLNDAEKRQASDDFVRSWLAEEVRPVAYDIDDVLDEFGYKILQQKVLNYSSPSNDISNMANKITIINELLNRFKGDIASFDLQAEFVNSIPEISFNMDIDSFLDDSVIEITETLPQYNLYNYWLIFKKRAFANERLLTPELEKIGREIVKNCERVPWAARFLGGIMYFIRDKDEWLSIQKKKFWDLLDNDNDGVFHILKLGYDHLPTPSLKRCFAYCAIFPKDYAMKKDEVIQHWIAEGFLEPSKKGDTVMEDIANTYFNILLATSFFQNARKDVCGDIISCKMHNLVHDFALSISKSDILILEGDSMNNVSKVQPLEGDSMNHVSKVQPLFVRSDGKTTPRTSFSGDSFIKMRTLISENLDFDDMLSNFKCLRVLKLFGCSIMRLPNSIERLKHLRLLHILDTKIEELPKVITELYNLQTLRIEECPRLKNLPEDLSNLINLRHIIISVEQSERFSNVRVLPEDLSNLNNLRHIHIFSCTPKNMSMLTCLQTLPYFGVGSEDGYRITELGALKNLKGEIVIKNLEYVKDEEEAKSAKLKEKEIFKLGLYWSYGRVYGMYDKDEKVLEGLQPHPNLKSLTIRGYRGKKFPSWVGLSSLLYHNLIEITLYWCRECEEVPTLGQLPCLRVLEMREMWNVRCIGSEFYFYSDGSYRNTTTTLFPALRILKLLGMDRLEEWKDAKELTTADEVLFVFPCLEELTLINCLKLRDLPDSLHTCVSLQKLVVQECPMLKSLPGVRSSGLQYLENGDCRRLPSSSTSSIHPSLQKLKLSMWNGSVLFLDQIQSFIALKILWIQSFNAIESLPEELGNLSSLQQLCIVNCWKLVHLPTEEAMRRLTQLKTLIIYECPEFEDNERIKISHVPWVEINAEGHPPRCKDFED